MHGSLGLTKERVLLPHDPGHHGADLTEANDHTDASKKGHGVQRADKPAFHLVEAWEQRAVTVARQWVQSHALAVGLYGDIGDQPAHTWSRRRPIPDQYFLDGRNSSESLVVGVENLAEGRDSCLKAGKGLRTSSDNPGEASE